MKECESSERVHPKGHFIIFHFFILSFLFYLRFRQNYSGLRQNSSRFRSKKGYLIGAQKRPKKLYPTSPFLTSSRFRSDRSKLHLTDIQYNIYHKALNNDHR